MKFTIIGVSHWAYDANSVAMRNHTGKTEEFFMEKWNTLLQEKFHINLSLEGAFIDSWSQQPWNKEDENQQVAFERETEKLQSFAENNDIFLFRTVGDVMEENQQLKAEIKWLNDVITNNITALTQRITKNEVEIGENADSIDHVADKANMNEKAIDEIDMVVGQLVTAPIGTVTAWLGTDPASSVLPAGWERCDGHVITSGPMKGKQTPNLNGEGYFLRGGMFEQVGSMFSDQLKSHTHAASTHVTDPGHTHYDTGHKHGYNDEYNDSGDGDNANDRHMANHNPHPRTTDTSHAQITKENTNIEVEVTIENSGASETYPKHMVVEWIMKVE